MAMSTALITGASGGIGEAFARELASRKLDLFLVARSQDKLQQLTDSLSKQHGVKVEFLAQDLTEPNAVTNVFNAIQSIGWQIDLLVNNAGFGDYGIFANSDRHKQLNMIQLNIAALVDLTHQFLPLMQQRQTGSIINVSSIGGFLPLPHMSTYAATKAFVLSFSEALWAENRDRGIRVQCLCPGATETGFFDAAGMEKMGVTEAQKQKQATATAQEVVLASLKALESNQNQPVVVTGGFGNHMVANIGRFLPRKTSVSLVEKLFRPKQQG